MGYTRETLEKNNREYEKCIEYQNWEREKEERTINWLITLSDKDLEVFFEKVRKEKKTKEEKERRETIAEYKKIMAKMEKLNIKIEDALNN